MKSPKRLRAVDDNNFGGATNDDHHHNDDTHLVDAYDREDRDTNYVLSALAESRESLKVLVRT